MKSRKDFPSELPFWVWVLIGAALVMFGLLLGGCGTVIPRKVGAGEASWDGGRQNSGFLGFYTNHSGVLTQRATERYAALCGQYGGKITPRPFGREFQPFTNGTVVMQAEWLSAFATMNRWKKSGVK
jgi:hypothetical protein